MIIGIGTDLVDVKRLQKSIESHGGRFTDRIFTTHEIAYCEQKANKYERLSARFAAKEAGMKALGSGWAEGVGWHDLELVNLAGGRPTLKLHGEAAALAARLGATRSHLSLTHTAEQAMAYVILES